MKFFTSLLFVTISLCASLCCPPENDNFQSIAITNNEIIKVKDNQSLFKVNDKIQINIIIKNKQVSTNNETLFLTDYLDNPNETLIYNSLILQKETAFNTIAAIPVSNDAITVTQGRVTAQNQYIQIESLYNGTDFISTFSIDLPEAGTYYLSRTNFDNLVFFSVNTNNEYYLSINSKIINSTDNNQYKFVVE